MATVLTVPAALSRLFFNKLLFLLHEGENVREAEQVGHQQHQEDEHGCTDDIAARLEAHRSGRGARLMQVITEHGIGWSVARTWPGGRQDERRLKNQKHAPRLCPLCRTAVRA